MILMMLRMRIHDSRVALVRSSQKLSFLATRSAASCSVLSASSAFECALRIAVIASEYSSSLERSADACCSHSARIAAPFCCSADSCSFLIRSDLFEYSSARSSTACACAAACERSTERAVASSRSAHPSRASLSASSTQSAASSDARAAAAAAPPPGEASDERDDASRP